MYSFRFVSGRSLSFITKSVTWASQKVQRGFLSFQRQSRERPASSDYDSQTTNGIDLGLLCWATLWLFSCRALAFGCDGSGNLIGRVEFE